MRVSVTQKNIDEAGYGSCNCPIALAIRDVFPDAKGKISVWPHIIFVAGQVARPSLEVATWILAYDQDRTGGLMPFDFDMEFEQEKTL